MPEQTATPVALATPAPQSATEYLNRTDEELEAAIARPGAAQAARRGAVDPTAAPPEPEKPAAAVATPPAEVEKPAAEPAAEAAPEVPAKPEEPAKPPLTTFTVKDAEGELEAPLELRFDFKANGKEYKEVPLDKLVKMAQMGYYNEEREDQVLAAKQFVAEAQQKDAEHQRQIQEYDAQVARLLSDDAFRQRAIDLFQQQNSPEQRAARAEQRVQDIEQQQAQQRELQQVAGFVQQELTPRMQRLITGFPLVSEEELLGYYTKLTAPLLQAGRVPPHRFPEVVRLVDTDLAHWVEAKQEERAGNARTQQKAAEAARTEVAQVKRTLARRTAPPSASAPAQPRTKPFSTATEWLNSRLPTPDE